jgi:hypothetical protein
MINFLKKKPVISLFGGLFDIKTGKDFTHNISSLYFDSLSKNITIVIEKGVKVEQIVISCEHAKDIGFINIEKLAHYCK